MAKPHSWEHTVNVIRVTDLSDPRLSDFANLTDVALRRRTEPAGGLYIAESSKVIARALRAGHQPRAILVLEQWLDDVAELLGDSDTPVYVGDSDVLEQLTGFNLHRGALASMHRPVLSTVAELVKDARRIVILEDIVDHTNVGAIFRSAAALGADAVLITPRCADPLYRRSVRVSMGTVLQVPWTRIPNWPEDAAELKAAGFHLAALALNDDSVDLDAFAADPPEKVALILGTEGDGLSLSTINTADTIVKIPMMHGVDSLNVAAASAVGMYMLRAR
ncbi:RNA methyltransferase [Salinibacterium sp. SWN1162]|uniref:TrmH family RNA methyltransferase n=1 Tax=Salinibacterium sp. SWN1162 TaxID=2792053 RepID=UPI001E4C49C1